MSKTIYNFKLDGLSGGTVDFATYSGKKILIVNVASACGYTSQYAQLQELSEEMKDNVVVIGCPCNQFGGQESGSAEEIQQFCQVNFGVTFPLTEKLEVKGSNAHPLYKWLTRKSENGVADSEVSWNFNKYLINEKGEFVSHFASDVSPFEAV
jgi:glutathione peroxidase